MKKVAIEDIWDMLEERSKINKLELSEIQWTLDGKDLEIDRNIIDDFMYTGLNPIDFIGSGFWRTGVKREVLIAAGLDLE